MEVELVEHRLTGRVMSHLRKFLYVLMIAASALAAVGPGFASASLTATVSPDPSAITGTGGTVQFTFNTARRTFNCFTSNFTGTLASATGASPLVVSSNLTWRFSTCTQTGGLRFTLTCASNQSLTVTGVTVLGITPGLVGFDCQIAYVPPVCSVRFSGTMTQSYDNYSGQMTISSPRGQSLSATQSTCASLPNDASVSIGSSVGGNFVMAVTPATTITVV